MQKAAIKGFSSIELLTSLCLSACICSIAYPAMHICIKNYYALSHRIEETSRIAQITNIIQNSLDSQEALLGIPSIWVHPTGTLSTIEQKPVIQNSLNIKNISPQSNAISIRTIDSKNLYSVISQNIISNKTTLKICGNAASDNSESIENSKYWIGLSLDGHTAIKGQIHKANIHSPACNNGHTWQGIFEYDTDPIFTSSQHLSSQTSTNITWQLRAIAPIKDAYTIYLDQNQTLKRASHYTIENQPMAHNITTFKANQLKPHLFKLDIEAHKLNTTGSIYAKAQVDKESKTISASIIITTTEQKEIHLLNILL